MKRIFLPLMLLCALALTTVSCGDHNDDVTEPSATGTMTDREGNTYPWVRIGDLEWMAENLRCADPWYNNPLTMDNHYDGEANLAKYGNFYLYEDAVKYCPDGWRLPTDDDWKALERALGVKNVDRFGWADGGGLAMASAAGLHLVFGGKVYHGNNDYGVCSDHNVGEQGVYWTATKDTVTSDEELAYYRKVMPNINKVERFTIPTHNVWLSVRYVRDAK